jgi:hypothetical protein
MCIKRGKVMNTIRLDEVCSGYSQWLPMTSYPAYDKAHLVICLNPTYNFNCHLETAKSSQNPIQGWDTAPNTQQHRRGNHYGFRKPFSLKLFWQLKNVDPKENLLRSCWSHAWQSLILAICLSLACAGLPVHAQAAVQVDKDEASLDFPTNIHFALAAHSSAAIEQVQLIYRTNARSCLSSSARKDMDFQKGNNIQVDWNWDLFRSANLPPGAVVSWQWQIQDAAGNQLITPERSLNVEDSGYPWKKIQAGGATIYWSAGDTAFGQLILNTSASSLARLAKEAGIARPDAVRLMIYPSTDALKDAVLHVPDWIGGIAFPEYGTVMIGIEPQDKAWAASVVPHELAHMVVGQRIDNCLGNDLPTWFNEGLAMFAEGPTTPEDKTTVKNALKNDQLPTLISLAGNFPDDSGRANLAYAQSGMVVAYLIDTYGTNRLDELLGKIQQGTLIDTALSEVYHLDTTGVDKAWRASLGFGSMPPTTAAVTARATQQRTAVPTFALYTAAPQATATLPAAQASATATVQPSPAPQLASPTPAAGEPTLKINATATPDLPVGTPSALPWILAGVGACLLAGLAVLWRLRKQ